MSAPAPFSSCPRAVRLACTRLYFDIDDTVTWRGRLPEEAVRALYRAKAAGLSLCAVTGRSFAWAELIVRLFPVDAVIAETGAVALWLEHDGGIERLRVMHHEDDATERTRLKRMRDDAAAHALREIPTARLADDSVGRVSDTAFDLVESGPPVPEDDVNRLRDVLHARGLVTARSSVHVNAFAFGKSGAFDKATMVDRLLRTRDGVSLSDAAPTLCYVGDSKNDGPLFARVGVSVGVRNVLPHVEALHALGQAPAYVTDGDGGYGFAAVVAGLLEDRDAG